MEVLTTSPSMAEQVSAQPEFGPQMPLSEKLLAIAIRAQNFTGASGVAVAIKEGQEIVCRASWGTSAPDVGVRLQDQNSFTYQCMRAGKSMRCDDGFSDPRVDNAACRALGIRSIAAAPVTSGDVLGVIAAFSEDPNTFTETHLVVLTTLGEVVGKFLKDSEPVTTHRKDDLLSIEDELPDAPLTPQAAAEPAQPVAFEPPKPVEAPKPEPVRVAEAPKPVEPPRPAPVKTSPPPTLPSQQAPAKTPFSAPAPAASANKPGIELEREPAIRPDSMMSSSEIRRDPSLVNSDAPVPPVPVTAKPVSKLSSLGDKRPAWLGIIDNAAKKDLVVEPLAAEPTAPSNLREFPAVNPPLQSKVVPISPQVRNDEINLTFTEPAEPVMVDRRKYLMLGGAAAMLVLVLGLWTWHSRRSSQAVPQAPPAPVQQQQVAENDPSFQTPPPPVDQTQSSAPVPTPVRSTDKPTAQKPSGKSAEDKSVTVEDTVTLVESPIRTPAAVAKPAPEPEAPPSVTITSASLPADLLAVKTALPRGPAPPTSHFVPSEVLLKVRPVYPEVAKRYHMQGKVVLNATIDATGKVKSVKIIDGPPAFHQSAVEAVKHWKYKPASLNGQAVESSADITLNFAVN